MLIVETVVRIRREHAAGKAIKAIARDLRLSRKVVRKAIRSPEAAFNYQRKVQPLPRIRACGHALLERERKGLELGVGNAERLQTLEAERSADPEIEILAPIVGRSDMRCQPAEKIAGCHRPLLRHRGAELQGRGREIDPVGASGPISRDQGLPGGPH
jgi:hypothetical protein